MIRLDTTTRKLQVVLAGNVTANQLPIEACWSDKTSTSYTGGSTPSNTNNTTAVDVVAAPSASTVRDVDNLSVRNADTAAATVTVRYNDNGTTYDIVKVTLAVGDMLGYTHAGGWFCLDSAGQRKTVNVTPSAAGGLPTGGSQYDFLMKDSATNYATSFYSIASGLVAVDPSPADMISVYQAANNRNAATRMVRTMGYYDRARIEHRLTLTTAVPVTTTDVTGATTIYFTPTPAGGSWLWMPLFDGTRWLLLPCGEISVAIGTVTSGLPYDLFAYANSAAITAATNATPIVITSNSHGMSNGQFVYIEGAVGNYAANGIFKIANVATNTFELTTPDGTNVAGSGTWTSGGTWYAVKLDAPLAWTNGTTRATAIATQDGVLSKTGALTRRLMGSFYSTSTTATADALATRFLSNVYNREPRKLRRQSGDSSWAYSTATWRQVNATTANKVEVFATLTGRHYAEIQAGFLVGGNSVGVACGIGVNSTSANSADFQIEAQAVTGVSCPAFAFYAEHSALGYTAYNWLEYVRAGSPTMYGSALADNQAGMSGNVLN